MARIDLPAEPRIELRDLRLVLALAASGTTARASKLLHLSQPAVSRALLSLEERLGVAVFERSPKGLRLTEAGELLRAEAPGVLAAARDLEARARAPREAPSRLRLVAQCTTAYHWLPSALAGLRASLPGVALELAVEHTQSPAEALCAGLIDVALLIDGPPEDEACESRSLFLDEVVFALSPAHPLARRRSLARKDLLAHPLATTPVPRSQSRWFAQRAFGRSKARPRFELLPLTEAVVDYARAGLGVAVLSEWQLEPHLARGGLVVRRLAAGILRREWSLAWRREARPAALRLCAALQATAPRHHLA